MCCETNFDLNGVLWQTRFRKWSKRGVVTGDPKLRQAAQHSYSITVKKGLRNTSKRGQKTLRIGSRGSLIYVSLTLQHSTQPVIYNKFSVSEKPLVLLSANGVINSNAIGCFEHCDSHSYHGRHKMLVPASMWLRSLWMEFGRTFKEGSVQGHNPHCQTAASSCLFVTFSPPSPRQLSARSKVRTVTKMLKVCYKSL